jgi:hypothetical protein
MRPLDPQGRTSPSTSRTESARVILATVSYLALLGCCLGVVIDLVYVVVRYVKGLL